MRTFFFAAILLSLLTPTRANPPDSSFEWVCDMYVAAEQGQSAAIEIKECRVTGDIDLNYHQPPVGWSGGGATSDLVPVNGNATPVPAGFYFEVSGGRYWSVLKPLESYWVLTDDNAKFRLVRAKLYCGPGGGNTGGCNTTIRVYAKRPPK